MYKIVFSDDARKGLVLLQKKYPIAVKKLRSLLKEICEDPRFGTGQAERLKYYKEETWSRRITREHRIVYRINEDVVEVLVLSVFGHNS